MNYEGGEAVREQGGAGKQSYMYAVSRKSSAWAPSTAPKVCCTQQKYHHLVRPYLNYCRRYFLYYIYLFILFKILI
jgi:hypothetical protein